MGLCCSQPDDEQECLAGEAPTSAADEEQRSEVDEAPRTAVDEEQRSAVDEEQRSAVVNSPCVDDLRFENSLPRQDYIQQLMEDFRQSSSPECMRRLTFNAGTVWPEYVSASCHLPGAYAEFFPCHHCTSKDEEGRTSFIEVFHFANVHTPTLCATVTFVMAADTPHVKKSTGCRVEVDFTKGCPNAPIAVHHSPRVLLHIATDVLIEVLRFLPRNELEKVTLVSRRCANVIGWAAGTVQQRSSFFVRVVFYGESPGMLSLHFYRWAGKDDQWRILRVLTTRGLSQALDAVRSHLRDAFVERVIPVFMNRVPAHGDPPREILFDIPLSARIDWLYSLLRSMPPNSKIGSLYDTDYSVGFDNLPAVASCALEHCKKLAGVQYLHLGMHNPGVTWARLASVLNQPCIRAFSEITVSTKRAAIDTAELRALISSWQSHKLHISVHSRIQPQDGILTLPAEIIRDFLALRDANSFVGELSLRLRESDNVAFSETPDVAEATDRRKRFRCRIQGKHTVVRVGVYGNRAAREYLTVVTFDHFRRNVLVLKGNVPLDDLKLTMQRPYIFH
ncbi:hypothetical protein AAVH_21903 [Aphelenchoides avenae]|nr:hypothetical protein AAVH_21903 [Aphelenchus avenae]